jgi:hypothetical protein
MANRPARLVGTIALTTSITSCSHSSPRTPLPTSTRPTNVTLVVQYGQGPSRLNASVTPMRLAAVAGASECRGWANLLSQGGSPVEVHLLVPANHAAAAEAAVRAALDRGNVLLAPSTQYGVSPPSDAMTGSFACY